ncbi:Protein of unknown function [Cohaesibacter sp. ES.047]|uniref:AsmA-like C-terminal region-containing protein n=1 Tax=Cohaesibacter sp. ES.047 TaxID=1798205 RepID=UPI000BB7AFE5|nr:AsmA-like C-terminal region-containing protein [Cohaesibacter sp. ES.047]SNY93778.1 Protein of unknown function [Cohaesibacter sp. ES.047]
MADELNGIPAEQSAKGNLSEGGEGPNGKKRRPVVRKILYVLGGLVLVLCLVIGLGALRLWISPLSVSSFLTEIEEEAADRLPEGQMLDIEDAQISLAENGLVALRLSNVTLREGERILLSAPRIDLEAGLMDLFDRRFRPSMIFIPSMRAHVERDERGRFLIAGQDPGAMEEVVGPPVRSEAIFYDASEPGFVSYIYAMRRAIRPLADDDLKKRPPRILIRDTQVTFDDAIDGRSRTFEKVAFSYNPIGEKDNLWRIDFAADGSNGRIGFAMAEFPMPEEERGVEGRSIEFRFADVALADFSPELDNDRPGFQFSSPFYGGARLDFDLKGELVGMLAALDVGAGQLDFGEKDTALLDEASFRFEWVPRLRALRLTRGDVHFGETGGAFKGLAIWPKSRKGDIRIALEGTDITLAARDNPLPPEKLNKFILNTKIGRDTGIATIDRVAMLADEGSIQGSGSMAMVGGELTTGMTFVISQMPYDLLTQMWPISVANGARKWVIENVEKGELTGATVDLALTQSMLKRNEQGRLVLPDDAVNMTFGVKNARFKGFGDFPPAVGVNGTGLVTGRTFVSNLTKGRFITKGERSFTISSGRIEIPDHSEKPATGIIMLEGSGSAKALGEIVDSAPLHVLAKEKHTPDDVAGRAKARVQVSFPFIKNLKQDDVVYSAKITLEDFSSRNNIRGHSIKDATLTIGTDGKRIDIAGNGVMDGIKTNLDLTTSTDDSVELASNFQLQLFDDDRRNLGLDLDKWLRGPVAVKIAQSGGARSVTKVEVDLSKASLVMDEIGWRKKPNVSGKATFDVIQSGDDVTVENISISGDGFKAEGAAELHAKEGLKSLTISKLELSRGDRLRLDVVQSKKNFYTLRATGSILDLRGKLLASNLGASGEGAPPMQSGYVINASFDKVIGLSGHTITNFEGSQHVERGKVKSVRVRGLLDGQSSLEVSTKAAKQPVLHVSTGNAGALFRFMGVIDRVIGGRLDLSVVLRNGWDEISGSVYVKDFNISGEVAQQRASTLSTKQVNSQFERFTINYSGTKGIYAVTSGVLKGPVLGATVSGTIDMRNKGLSLSGTYIPAYTVNNIFSRLPLIGRALGNRKNEGLLGLTYQIKGKLGNPTVVVNPASILAPGVLRKLFEFR